MAGHATLGQAVKQTDAASYDGVAAQFDQMSERFSAPMAARVLEFAEIGPADRVVDLGTGAGLLALRAAERAPEGKVVGVDHSSGMLRQAEEKAARAGISERVSFRKMDAESLDFEACSFEVAVSLFVLLHLPDPFAAATELHRVLRPGGRVVVGLGAGPPLVSAAGAVQAGRRLLGAIETARGRMLSAPTFMQTLLADMGVQERDGGRGAPHRGRIDAGKLLADAGFERVRSTWAGAEFTLSPEEFWDVSAIYGSGERDRLAQLSAAQIARVKDEFMRRVGRVLSSDGRLIYHCGARIYAATRSREN